MTRNVVFFLAADLLLIGGTVVLLSGDGEPAARPEVPVAPQQVARRVEPAPQQEVVRPAQPDELEILLAAEADLLERWLEARDHGDWEQAADLKKRRTALRMRREALEAERAPQVVPEAPDETPPPEYRVLEGLRLRVWRAEDEARGERVPEFNPLPRNRDGTAPMPFGRSTFGPWDPGRTPETP